MRKSRFPHRQYRPLDRGGAPPEAIARLAEETQAVLATPEIKERLLALGLDSVPVISPAAFGEQIKADVANWAKIIHDANIRTE